MRYLSIRIKRGILNYINNNFTGSKVELNEYLLDISNILVTEICDKMLVEEFVDNLCDNTSDVYEDLANALMKLTLEDEFGEIKNVYIKYESPYYYVGNTEFGINSNKGNRKKYVEMLNYICSLHENGKGKWYQDFCTLFLKDIGVTPKITKYCNDGGIDIVGTLEVDFRNKAANIIFYDEIYVLIQVKFYKCKLDASVVRNMIGNSILYTLNMPCNEIMIGNKPLYLIVISHDGFYQKTKEYAKENSVILLDSERIIDTLCNTNKMKDLESIKYLNDIYMNLSKRRTLEN